MTRAELNLYDHGLQDLRFLDLLHTIHTMLEIKFDKLFIVRLLKQVKLYCTDESHSFNVSLFEDNLPT